MDLTMSTDHAVILLSLAFVFVLLMLAGAVSRQDEKEGRE